MSLLTSLPEIVEECRREYERLRNDADTPGFRMVERMGSTGDNRLVLGDNLDWLRCSLAEPDRRPVSLIYIDPPFYSKSNYRAEVRIASGNRKVTGVRSDAYQDRWGRGMQGFLSMLTLRLLFMRDLLAEDGGIIVHLDWRAVHYVKVIMDELFGQTRFVNEIIWTYKSGGASSRAFAKKHDTLLYYAAGRRHYFNPVKEKSYNRAFRPYRFRGVREYKDELGWYTMVNQKDVLDVDMVGRTAGERTGYATQKPEKLLEILLESCTKPGDVCADYFGGSGTLAAVAHRMGRQFISCDSSPLAMAATRKRLAMLDAPFAYCVSESEISGRAADVTADARISQTASEGLLCSVQLGAYRRDCTLLPVSAPDRKVVGELQDSDPLSLVDYWCVDPDYDGENFQSTYCFVRTKNGMTDRAEFLAGPNKRVAVKVYDAFGGFGLWERRL
jgi:site-specific DNA-methyltransferase (adenine-specific)